MDDRPWRDADGFLCPDSNGTVGITAGAILTNPTLLNLQNSSPIGIGGRGMLSPPTPPDVRFRIRRFADTARLPASPLWRHVIDVAGRTVAAWEQLAEKDLLPEKMRAAIGNQILTVAKSVVDPTPLSAAPLNDES